MRVVWTDHAKLRLKQQGMDASIEKLLLKDKIPETKRFKWRIFSGELLVIKKTKKEILVITIIGNKKQVKKRNKKGDRADVGASDSRSKQEDVFTKRI